MKKTVSIMALCALSVILSGCLKKKDKDTAMTTGERSESMEKPIKVASLSPEPQKETTELTDVTDALGTKNEEEEAKGLDLEKGLDLKTEGDEKKN